MSLNLFQILALIVLACLFILTLVAALRRWATRREAVLWASVWLMAGAAVIWPDLTAVGARALGIGRGADLLLYCTVVVMMAGFLMTYVRLRRLRADLTLLTRALAIRDSYVASAERATGTHAPSPAGPSAEENP